MQLRTILSLLFISALFVVSAYLTQTYATEISLLIGERSMLGIGLYTLITVLTTVVAPLSSVPLIAVAANIWGPIVAALASIVGWLLGGLIAFGISRRYGRTLVERMVSKPKLESIENRLARGNLFWSIVLLRIAVPVDVLSYALGLFSAIPWSTYALATLIGITPFAFVFAYAGTLSWHYQGFLLLGSFILLLIMWTRR